MLIDIEICKFCGRRLRPLENCSCFTTENATLKRLLPYVAPDLDANLRQPLPLDDEVLIDDTPDAEADMLKSKHAVTMSRLHRQRTTLQALVVDARKVYEGSLKELWDCERMLREAGEI